MDPAGSRFEELPDDFINIDDARGDFAQADTVTQGATNMASNLDPAPAPTVPPNGTSATTSDATSDTAAVSSIDELIRLERARIRPGISVEELEEIARKVAAFEKLAPAATPLAPTQARRRSDEDHASGRERQRAFDRLTKHEPPKFRGKQLTDHRQWLQTVENDIALARIAQEDFDDPACAIWAMKGFEGELLRRAQATQRDCTVRGVPLTWTLLQGVVQNYLSDPAIRQAISAIALFDARKQDSESLVTFQTRMESLESDFGVDIAEPVRIWLYFSKLPRPITNRLTELDRTSGLGSVAELMDEARKQEQLSKTRGRDHDGRSSEHRREDKGRKRSRSPERSSYRGSDQSSPRRGSSSSSWRGRSGSSNTWRKPEEKRSKPNDDRGNDRRQDKGKDDKGGGYSKPNAAPNTRPSQGASGQPQCFNCQGLGHFSRDCPSRR